MTKVKGKLIHQPVELNDIEKRLINRLQLDLPLVDSPFAAIGEELDLPEALVIATLQDLLERGVLTRFGPLFDISKNHGAFSLCALKVPENRIDEVTEIVNAFPEVAHNYLRENEWNMWFVLAASSKNRLSAKFDEIVAASGCPGIDCPKEKEFFVGLNLPV